MGVSIENFSLLYSDLTILLQAIHLYVAAVTRYCKPAVHRIEGQGFDAIAGSKGVGVGQLQELALMNGQSYHQTFGQRTYSRLHLTVYQG